MPRGPKPHTDPPVDLHVNIPASLYTALMDRLQDPVRAILYDKPRFRKGAVREIVVEALREYLNRREIMESRVGINPKESANVNK